MSKGLAVLCVAVVAFGVTQCVIWNDVDNVNRDEARAFLNTQDQFDSYVLGPEVQCVKTKHDDKRGIMFIGTNADGTTFDAIVCPSMKLVEEIPNQPDDPLDVIRNERSLFWPREGFYIRAIPEN
jgi:hypothetical protein